MPCRSQVINVKLNEKGSNGIFSLIELSLQSPLVCTHLPDKGFSDCFSASIAISVGLILQFILPLIYLLVVIFVFGLALPFRSQHPALLRFGRPLWRTGNSMLLLGAVFVELHDLLVFQPETEFGDYGIESRTSVTSSAQWFGGDKATKYVRVPSILNVMLFSHLIPVWSEL